MRVIIAAMNAINKPAQSWLVSSVGRALHRYRRGHGLNSLTNLNVFQALFSQLLLSSCENNEHYLKVVFITAKIIPILTSRLVSCFCRS